MAVRAKCGPSAAPNRMVCGRHVRFLYKRVGLLSPRASSQWVAQVLAVKQWRGGPAKTTGPRTSKSSHLFWR